MSDVSLSRKKELQEPDKFIVWFNKATKFIKENKTKVYSVLIAFSIVILIVSTYFGFQNYKINKAKKSHKNILQKYETLIEIDGFEKTYAQTKEDIDIFLKKYGTTNIGKLFGLSVAHLAYESKDYERALILYNKALSNFDKDKALKSLIVSDIAMTYESLKNYTQAINYFQMVTSDINSVSKDEALFHLGYLYSRTNNKKKATEAYKNLLKYFPNSVYAGILKEKINIQDNAK